MVAMLGEGARSSELLDTMITVASDGGKCSHSTLVNECLKYPSGFRGRYFHFLAAWDEQVCSAASDKWRQMLDNQPTHSGVKVLKQSPPFLSMLDLVSARYVSSERAPDESIQC